jgi:hypothetical protein
LGLRQLPPSLPLAPHVFGAPQQLLFATNVLRHRQTSSFTTTKQLCTHIRTCEACEDCNHKPAKAARRMCTRGSL